MVNNNVLFYSPTVYFVLIMYMTEEYHPPDDPQKMHHKIQKAELRNFYMSCCLYHCSNQLDYYKCDL